LLRDRAVGLVIQSSRRYAIQPQRGESQLYRILETLAVSVADGQIAAPDLLRIEGPRIPKGSTAVVITASDEVRVATELRLMRRSGLFPVLIQLDPASFGLAAPAGDSAGAARKLGIPTHVIRCGEGWERSMQSEGTRRAHWAA
jgi:uncharacterized protein (DUF58 family)